MIEEVGVCSSCGVFGDLEQGLCVSCWDEEPKIRRRGNTDRYRHTENGQAYVREYNHSEPAKEARKRYAGSEKGKLAQERYLHSERGKATLERIRKRLETVRHFSELEALGLCGLCGQEGHEAEAHVQENGSGSSG